MFVHIFTVMQLLRLHWPTEEMIEMAAWSTHTHTHTHTHTQSSPIWCPCPGSIRTNRIDLYMLLPQEPLLDFSSWLRRGARCYWSNCSWPEGMTAGEDDNYLLRYGPCAVEAFSPVWAIGRPHINWELWDAHGTGGYWLSSALWGSVVVVVVVVVKIILGAAQVVFRKEVLALSVQERNDGIIIMW